METSSRATRSMSPFAAATVPTAPSTHVAPGVRRYRSTGWPPGRPKDGDAGRPRCLGDTPVPSGAHPPPACGGVGDPSKAGHTQRTGGTVSVTGHKYQSLRKRVLLSGLGQPELYPSRAGQGPVVLEDKGLSAQPPSVHAGPCERSIRCLLTRSRLGTGLRSVRLWRRRRPFQLAHGGQSTTRSEGQSEIPDPLPDAVPDAVPERLGARCQRTPAIWVAFAILISQHLARAHRVRASVIASREWCPPGSSA